MSDLIKPMIPTMAHSTDARKMMTAMIPPRAFFPPLELNKSEAQEFPAQLQTGTIPTKTKQTQWTEGRAEMRAWLAIWLNPTQIASLPCSWAACLEGSRAHLGRKPIGRDNPEKTPAPCLWPSPSGYPLRPERSTR